MNSWRNSDLTKFTLYNTEYTLRAYTLTLRDIAPFGRKGASNIFPLGGGDKRKFKVPCDFFVMI